jgi:CubicO group peptidase (beta-lactamase class C family)
MKTEWLSDAILKARETLQAEWACRVPGLCVAAAVNGETVWSEAFGFADLEKQIPATVATRFRIGSVSKPIAAAGLALLLERGQFDLDAPIQKYIPDFPQKDGVITPRLLAGHLSGIRNYRDKEFLSNKAFPDLRSGLKVFEDDPLESPPGTKYSYASYNWNTLGAAMEAATGQDFPSYIESNVLKPLGLADTHPDRTGAEDPHRTKFYEVNREGKFILGPPVDLSYCWPGGGYLGTAVDMARFGSAHLRPGFLQPESVKLLFTSQKTADGKPTGYGIGWVIEKNIVLHSGGSIGGISMLLLVPASRVSVAIACNVGPLVLNASIRKGRATEDAKRMVVNPKATACKIAVIFTGLALGKWPLNSFL